MPDTIHSTNLNDTFQFCPRCGSSKTEVGKNPFRCSDCDFVFYFSPVSAVGAIIVDHQGRHLFLVRGKNPGRGKLGLPGGFSDAGETLETSLRREVMEETSLVVESIDYLCSFPNRYCYRGVTVEVLDCFFVCTVSSFDSLAAQEGEVQEIRIIEPTEATLDQLAFESNRKAVEFYLSAKNSAN